MKDKKITQMGVRTHTKEELKSFFSEHFFGAHIKEQDMIASLLAFAKLEFAKKSNDVETLRKIHNEITINQKEFAKKSNDVEKLRQIHNEITINQK